jgi:hypothetical protein
MHVGYRVWVEWGIGGLKREWKVINEKVWFHKAKIHSFV